MEKYAESLEGVALAGGRYRVRHLLGEGGMGQVYRAWDENLETDVVIKVPRREMLGDPEFADRFQREIRSLVKLAHPHIVKINDVSQYEGVPFAVMQFLSGGNLEERRSLDATGTAQPMPLASLNEWLPAVADALDFVHGQGYVHRDVKPENIIFDAHGNAYLSDFGVVKAVAGAEQDGRRTAKHTGTGVAIGTPEYMAPELVMGEKIDGRIDQYALAVTIYEMLAGETPIGGPTAGAVLVNQTAQTPSPLREESDRIPGELSDAVMRGLAKSRAERFPDCLSFSRAVLQALPEPAAAESARGPSTPPQARSQTSQGPRGRVPCPQCRKVLRFGEKHAGKPVRCPNCRTKLRVAASLDAVSVFVPRSTGAQSHTMALNPATGLQSMTGTSSGAGERTQVDQSSYSVDQRPRRATPSHATRDTPTSWRQLRNWKAYAIGGAAVILMPVVWYAVAGLLHRDSATGPAPSKAESLVAGDDSTGAGQLGSKPNAAVAVIEKEQIDAASKSANMSTSAKASPAGMQKNTEPEWLPAHSLIADAGRVVISLKPRGTPKNSTDDAEGLPAAGTGFGRGERFVSVRGIVPFRDQVQAVAMSTHASSPDALGLVEYREYQLQRQRAIAGSEPWAGEWEDVDTEIAKELLAEASGVEPDSIDSRLKTPVLTLPLPARVLGEWSFLATHPAIDDSLLPSEGELPDQANDGQKSAAGNMLLFRYIDFDVEPGNAYRYRVRLVMRNPNYGRPSDLVADVGVAEGRTRVAAWSEPTSAVLVPDDTEYFVQLISPRHGHLPASAKFDVFQWRPETGTVINTDSISAVIGSFIGGRASTLVLNPAEGTLAREDVTFATDDVLIDLAPQPRLDSSTHPHLKLPRGGDIEVPPAALTVDRYGGLKSIDSELLKQKHADAKQRLKSQLQPFQGRIDEFVRKEGMDPNCSTCSGVGHVSCPNSRCRNGTVRVRVAYTVNVSPIPQSPSYIRKTRYDKYRCSTCRGRGRLDCPHCTDGSNPEIQSK